MAKMLAATLLLSMVIRLALSKINLWSPPSAEELVLGTAIVESGLIYLRQWGDGPSVRLMAGRAFNAKRSLYKLPELSA